MDYVRRLNDLVSEYIRATIPLPEFQQRFSSIFVDEIPDSALNEQQWNLYGAIHEKSEWVAEDPVLQDRRDGWLDAEEFRVWLKRIQDSGMRIE